MTKQIGKNGTGGKAVEIPAIVKNVRPLSRSADFNFVKAYPAGDRWSARRSKEPLHPLEVRRLKMVGTSEGQVIERTMCNSPLATASTLSLSLSFSSRIALPFSFIFARSVFSRNVFARKKQKIRFRLLIFILLLFSLSFFAVNITRQIACRIIFPGNDA